MTLTMKSISDTRPEQALAPRKLSVMSLPEQMS